MAASVTNKSMKQRKCIVASYTFQISYEFLIETFQTGTLQVPEAFFSYQFLYNLYIFIVKALFRSSKNRKQ